MSDEYLRRVASSFEISPGKLEEYSGTLEGVIKDGGLSIDERIGKILHRLDGAVLVVFLKHAAGSNAVPKEFTSHKVVMGTLVKRVLKLAYAINKRPFDEIGVQFTRKEGPRKGFVPTPVDVGELTTMVATQTGLRESNSAGNAKECSVPGIEPGGPSLVPGAPTTTVGAGTEVSVEFSDSSLPKVRSGSGSVSGEPSLVLGGVKTGPSNEAASVGEVEDRRVAMEKERRAAELIARWVSKMTAVRARRVAEVEARRAAVEMERRVVARAEKVRIEADSVASVRAVKERREAEAAALARAAKKKDEAEAGAEKERHEAETAASARTAKKRRTAAAVALARDEKERRVAEAAALVRAEKERLEAEAVASARVVKERREVPRIDPVCRPPGEPPPRAARSQGMVWWRLVWCLAFGISIFGGILAGISPPRRLRL